MARLSLHRLTIFGAAVMLLATTSLAGAVVVGGGGSSSTDCLVAFDATVNHPEHRPRNYRCTDGDPCDADGTVNGVCAFQITTCANSSYNPASCNLVGVDTIRVDHALDNGDPKFDPDYQALQANIDNDIEPPNNDVDACTGIPTTIRVAIEGPFRNGAGQHFCKKRRKKLKIVSTGIIAGKVVKDTDKFKITCDPAPAGCDPVVLFDSTFDRIQTQIFNQSCALSGCHDSQTTQGNLLLEQGASLGQLIGVTPDNDAAEAAGWTRVNRIDPMTGDPATSYLFHKITGDLGKNFGDRMPQDRPKLNPTLIDVIEAWIAAGAPPPCVMPATFEECWVPGTF